MTYGKHTFPLEDLSSDSISPSQEFPTPTHLGKLFVSEIGPRKVLAFGIQGTRR